MELVIIRRDGSRHVVLFDEADADIINKHSWHVWTSPLSKTFYAATNITTDGKRRPVLMHRLLIGEKWIDHIDRNGLNNQRINLRPASRSLQSHNQPARVGTSRYRGVYWDKTRSSWSARLKVDGKTKFLGRFSSEEDAAEAYDRAALAAYGADALVNTVHARPRRRLTP